MKSSRFNRLLVIFMISIASSSYSQQIVNHHVDFESGAQNMWGPSWSPFNINQTVNLFEVNWNESFSTSAIVSILGAQFGAGLDGNFSGTIGSNFSLSGFSTGTVEVDYPIDIVLDMPTDLSYDQGDQVTIETDYTVDPNYALDTYYPTVGEINLDLYFQMGAGLSATICVFGCTTFPVIPNFNTGLQNINIFSISPSGAEFFSFNGGAPAYSFPGLPLNSSTVAAPADPLGDYGLTIIIDLPYVSTTDGISGFDLNACGEDPYVNLNLDIFALLGNIPGTVGTVLGNLSGSEDFGPANVSWNFFNAQLDVNNYNKQCFDFRPKVYGRFEFPVAVEYDVQTPGGSIISSGTSSIINAEIGNEINYKFPCYYENMDIVSTYSIDGQFTNHTYDSIAFDLLMSAFAFSLTIPSIEITPEINVPEICIPIPYPCPSWSCPWCWCTYTVCTPAFTIPAITSPAINWSFGPLWSTSIPLGSITYDWYNNTWALEGFSQYTFAPFTMNANPLGISNVFTDVSCYGGNDGAINITTTAVSPATPFVYTWTNGAGTEDLTGLTAGSYNVSVIDANGCQMFTGATIQEPQQPLSITYTTEDKNCNGGPDDGSIDILVQGGTPGYSFSWSNSAITEDISGLAAGAYTVTVTDSRLCTETATITINEPNLLGQVAALTSVNCTNDSDGEIAIDVFGGVLPYTFAWTGPAAFTSSLEDISGLAGGSYTLLITDGNNCTSSQTYVISEPATVVAVSATGVDVPCIYDSTGSIDVTTLGGTPGYTYQWINSLGIVLPYSTEDLSNIPADNYTVVVTDMNGCQVQTTQLITQPAMPISSAEVLTDVQCFGNATGNIDPVISGGTGPYNYNWSTGPITPTLGGLSAGTYTLTVTDANGCIEVFSYTLIGPTVGLSLSLTGTDVLCNGDNTGEVEAFVLGGTGAYTYVWSNGGGTATISNLLAGPYNLTVTDGNGCTILGGVTLLEPLLPLSLSSTFIDVDCYGNNTGSIDVSPVGGTGPYTQVWWTSGSTMMVDTTEDVSNLLVDVYTVLVTDNNGCTDTLNTVINGPAAPISISVIVNDVNCFGLNDGGIDATVIGGTATYGFSWSSGEFTEDINLVTAGNYILTVTDFNGCIETISVDVIEPQAPLAIITYPISVLCNGGNDGAVESGVSGGTLPYTYSWSGGETTADIENLSAGSYTLTVTDGQGCTAFSGAVVAEPALALVVTPTVLDVSCYGYSDGEIVISIAGGVEPYYFNWGNQNEILLNSPSETIPGLTIGDYFIRVTDANGCVFEQIITVNEPTPFIGTYVVSDVLCYSGTTGSIDLSLTGGTLPYATVWSNGPITEDNPNVASATYTYVVTDGNGCQITDDVYVGEPNELLMSDEIVSVTCIDQSDAIILINPYGGTMPYTYTWSNGQTSQNADGLAPGFYDVTILDANGCTQTFNYEIVLNDDECIGIPNTFTPNGDNYNDTWLIRNIDLYPNAIVKVFNRWGNEIYLSEGEYKPWDGLYNDKPLPSEVYYYIIVLENDLDNKYTGTITIIR